MRVRATMVGSLVIVAGIASACEAPAPLTEPLVVPQLAEYAGGDGCMLKHSSDDVMPKNVYEVPYMHCASEDECWKVRGRLQRNGFIVGSCFAQGYIEYDRGVVTSWSFFVMWPEKCDIELEPYCSKKDDWGWNPPA